jgi:glycosyltransferase involved in cell wall biosynthesis
MRRDIAAEGLPLDRMTAVPMGIPVRDIPRTWQVKGRTVIPEGDRVFLYLGTLARVRRLDFLVRVLAIVRRSLPDSKLYIVGRGEDRADEQLLLDEAARLNVEAGLVMIGHLPREAALQYVKEADVCVSPFFPTPILNSTSPTKLVEYMAMGKAVVANDHPEQRLMIESSGAGYSVPWNEVAFAEAVVRLLSDPDQCASMGERGRRYVTEHRSYERIADSVERQLLRVLAYGAASS